jgi:hypothetical protein
MHKANGKTITYYFSQIVSFKKTETHVGCFLWVQNSLKVTTPLFRSLGVSVSAGNRYVRIGRGVKQGCWLSLIVLNLYSKHLTKEVHEEFGDFIRGERVIHTIKCADDHVQLAKEETVFQGINDTLTEIGRWNGNECEKTKVMRISTL